MQGLYLLHSEHLAASRDLLAVWNAQTPIPGEVIDSHEAVLAFMPAFPGYPAVGYEDAAGNRHLLFNPADLAAVTAWRDAIDNPVKSTVLSRYQFSQRMTPAERIAIREAGKTDAQVDDFLDLLSLAEQIDLADANVIGGLSLLVSKDLLTEARKTEILVP